MIRHLISRESTDMSLICCISQECPIDGAWLYETGRSHDRHDRMWPHVFEVCMASSSSVVAACSAISLMMSYKKLDDKCTPFLGYRQITIALIRPRLLSENRPH